MGDYYTSSKYSNRKLKTKPFDIFPLMFMETKKNKILNIYINILLHGVKDPSEMISIGPVWMKCE